MPLNSIIIIIIIMVWATVSFLPGKSGTVVMYGVGLQYHSYLENQVQLSCKVWTTVSFLPGKSGKLSCKVWATVSFLPGKSGTIVMYGVGCSIISTWKIRYSCHVRCGLQYHSYLENQVQLSCMVLATVSFLPGKSGTVFM